MHHLCFPQGLQPASANDPDTPITSKQTVNPIYSQGPKWFSSALSRATAWLGESSLPEQSSALGMSQPQLLQELSLLDRLAPNHSTFFMRSLSNTQVNFEATSMLHQIHPALTADLEGTIWKHP